MNETIIIDCSSPLWMAGLTGFRGRFVVAPVELSDYRNPYLWAEILLDRDLYESPDEEFLARLVRASGQNAGEAWDLGWYLSGETHPERVLPLKNPLCVLSEPYAVSGDAVGVRLAGIKLLMFLLRPLLKGLRRIGATPEKHPAVIVTPGFLGRMGVLCLLSALRRLGVMRPRLLPRSLALGLYGALVVGDEETVSVDSDEDGFTLRRVGGKRTKTSVALTLVNARLLPEIGWPDLQNRLQMEVPAWSPRSLRRVLFGVGPAPLLPKTSWDDFETCLCGSSGEWLHQSLKTHLAPAVRQLGWPDVGIVMSGLCFMVPGVERMAREALGAGEPFDSSLSTERPSRGVAAMTEWLNAKSGRTVELHRADGIFIEVEKRAYQVLPTEVMASLDRRQRTFRRLGKVSVPDGLDREVLGVRAVQGVGDGRQDRVSVGLWTKEIDLKGMAFEGELAVTLSLKRSGTPADIRGTMRVCLEQMEEEVSLHFVKSDMVFTS